MHNSYLTVSELRCQPGSQELFHGLNITVLPGQSIELRGPNGCGKSTLLRIMAGLQQPDAGKVVRFIDPVGYIGHKVALANMLTVIENLRWSSTLVGTKLDTKRTQDLLEEFQLTSTTNILVQELSAGQKRRCSFVSLLLGNYKLWLLDEPFNSLDRHGEELVREQIQAHCDSGGCTVIASHAERRISQAVQVELGSS